MSIGAFRTRWAALRNDQLALHLSQASAVSMAVRVAGLALAFLSHLMLSRTLGVREYGHYVIALGWAMVLVIPARLGLDNSVLRFATIYREQARARDLRGLVLFSLGLIAGISALIACLLLSAKALGAKPFRPIETSMLGGMILLIAGSAALGWFSSLIRTANRIFASQFYEQMLRPALLIAGLAILALLGLRPDSALAMVLTGVTVVIATIGIAMHARAAFREVAAGHASFEHRREWLSVSWILFLMAVFQEVLNQVDLILLGIFANATEAAHFAAAWRLGSLVPFGLMAIATVSAPLLASAHHRGDLGELGRIARLNARFATLFAVAMAMILGALGRPALGLFGPGFEAGFAPLAILLIGGLINSFTGTVGYLMIMTGHQRAALTILSVALLLSVAANMVLIPRLGATGAAIGSALGLSAWNLIMAAYVRRRIGVDATALGMRFKQPAAGRSVS